MMYHDVVTDWSSALAGFLVSMLFGVSPSNFSHCILSGFPLFFSTEV